MGYSELDIFFINYLSFLCFSQVAWRRISDDQFLTIGKVTWVQDSNLILEHLRKTDDVTTWDLILRRAQPEHAGDYECQITTSLKHVHLVTLSVIGNKAFSGSRGLQSNFLTPFFYR